MPLKSPPSPSSASERATCKSYYIIEAYIKIAVAINAVPFTYNKQTQRLSLDKGSNKYHIWYILMFSGMVLELSQVSRELVRALFDDNVNRGEWSLILFIFLSWVFITSVHYNVISNGEDMVTYHNHVMGIRTKIGEKNLPPTSDHKMVRAHSVSNICQCFFQCLMVAMEGTRNHYIYSMVPTEHRSSITTGIWTAYAYYRVTSNFLSGYFSIFTAVFHVQTCNQILQYRIQRKEPYAEAVKSYRLLQILCGQYNVAYATIFLPQITIFVSGNIMLGLYGSLRFMETMAPDLYMNFPLMALMTLLLTFTFYPNNATVKETSEQEPRRMLDVCTGWDDLNLDYNKKSGNPVAFEDGIDLEEPTITAAIMEKRKRRQAQLLRQNYSNELKIITCYAKSCPLVAVRMGTFYPIKRSTVLTLFSFICCNTISALLTWN